MYAIKQNGSLIPVRVISCDADPRVRVWVVEQANPDVDHLVLPASLIKLEQTQVTAVLS